MDRNPALPSSSSGDIQEDFDGPSGAFERFLTSALATILTIIFSWRFLLDGEAPLRQPTLEWREPITSSTKEPSHTQETKTGGNETTEGKNSSKTEPDKKQQVPKSQNQEFKKSKSLLNQQCGQEGANYSLGEYKCKADVPCDTNFGDNSVHVCREVFYTSCSSTCMDAAGKAWHYEPTTGSNEPKDNVKIINDAPRIEANYHHGEHSSRGGGTDMCSEVHSLPSTDSNASHRSKTLSSHAHLPLAIRLGDQAWHHYDRNEEVVSQTNKQIPGGVISKDNNGLAVLSQEQRAIEGSGVLYAKQEEHTGNVNIESEAVSNVEQYKNHFDIELEWTGVGTHASTSPKSNDADHKLTTKGNELAGESSTMERKSPRASVCTEPIEDTSSPGTENSSSMDMDSVRQRCQEILEKHNQIKESLYRDHYNTVATSDSFDASYSSGDDDGDIEDGMVVKTLKRDSDSDSESESLSSSYYGEREYVLSEPLGEDSSDSEYCIIFRRVLEAITEEDTDDLDTTWDTDVEMHDIPADDESGGVSDNQAETVAIGNHSRPFSNGASTTSSSSSSAKVGGKQNQRPQTSPNNGLRVKQLASSDGTQRALIDENKRDVTLGQASSVAGVGSSSRGSIYRAGREQGMLVSQRHETISRQMNIHMDKSDPMNAPLEVGEEMEELEGEEDEWDQKEEKEGGGREQIGAAHKASPPEGDLIVSPSRSESEPSSQDYVLLQSSFDLSDTDLASDTNSIDVAVDFEPEKIRKSEGLRFFGGLVNAHRPVTIGPYHDRQSAFARRSYINVHSPGDVSPRFNEEYDRGEEDEVDEEEVLKTPVVTEYKYGLEAALDDREQGVVTAGLGRVSSAENLNVVNIDAQTDGKRESEGAEGGESNTGLGRKIYWRPNQAGSSRGASTALTSPNRKADFQCTINVISVGGSSTETGESDSISGSNSSTSLPPPHTSNRFISLDTTHRLDPNNLPSQPQNQGDNRVKRKRDDSNTASPILHQAKSLREAALDAVNAPPHDDYYLQSQYYDCRPGGSSTSSSPHQLLRPLQQALSVSPASSFTRSSEADTGTDLEFDSAEDSSFSSRYRTPEGWSGADSFSEEVWRSSRGEEEEEEAEEVESGAGGVGTASTNTPTLPLEYTGRHGDGYVLEHWEETGNDTGSFVVDLKVDVHHLGTDTDQDNDSELDKSKSEETGIKQEQGTPSVEKEYRKYKEVKEKDSTRGEYEIEDSETESKVCGGQETEGEKENEIAAVDHSLETEGDYDSETGEETDKESSQYGIDSGEELDSVEIKEGGFLTGENKSLYEELEYAREDPREITGRYQTRIITVKASTSVTERPLSIGISPSKPKPETGAERPVYKNESKGIIEEVHDTKNTTGRPHSHSSPVMDDARSKMYQEFERLQDFKEEEEKDREKESNQGRGDKAVDGSQQSFEEGRPLDPKSHEIGWLDIGPQKPGGSKGENYEGGGARGGAPTGLPHTTSPYANRDRYEPLLKGDHNSSLASIRPINTLELTIDQMPTSVGSAKASGSSTNGSVANSYIQESSHRPAQVATSPGGACTSNIDHNGGRESTAASELHTQNTATSTAAITQSSPSTGGKATEPPLLKPNDYQVGDSELDSSTRYVWCLDSSINKNSSSFPSDDQPDHTFNEPSWGNERERGSEEQVPRPTVINIRTVDIGSSNENIVQVLKEEETIRVTESPGEHHEVVFTVSKRTTHGKQHGSDYAVVNTGNQGTDQPRLIGDNASGVTGLSLNISQNKQDHEPVSKSSTIYPISVSTGENELKDLNIRKEIGTEPDTTVVFNSDINLRSKKGNDYDQALGKVLTDSIKSENGGNKSEIKVISERATVTEGLPGDAGMPGYHRNLPAQSPPSRVIYQRDDLTSEPSHSQSEKKEGISHNNSQSDSQYIVSPSQSASAIPITTTLTTLHRDQKQHYTSTGAPIPTGIFYIPGDQQGTGVRHNRPNGGQIVVRTGGREGRGGEGAVQLPSEQVDLQPKGVSSMGNKQDGGVHYGNEIQIDSDSEYGFQPMHDERDTFRDKYDLYYSNDEGVPTGLGGHDTSGRGKLFVNTNYDLPSNINRQVNTQADYYKETHFPESQPPSQRVHEYLSSRDFSGNPSAQVKYASIKKTNDPRVSSPAPPLSPRSPSGSWGQQDPHAYLDRSYQDLDERLAAAGYQRIDSPTDINLSLRPDQPGGYSRQGYKGDHQAHGPPQVFDYSQSQIFDHPSAANALNHPHLNLHPANRPHAVHINYREPWADSDRTSTRSKTPPWRSDRSPSRSPGHTPTSPTPPPHPGERSSSLFIPRLNQTDSRGDNNLHLASYDDRQNVASPRSCTALATSTALARKDTGQYDDGPMSPGDASKSVVSAIGNAEARGENPYIAVARATARAATIASAHAAAGVAKMPLTTSHEKTGSDINVVISTSCTIKNEQAPRLEDDSQDVIKLMDVVQPGGEFQNRMQQSVGGSATRQQMKGDDSLDPPQKMVITIEQEGTQEKRSKTIECELPVNPHHDDLTRIINAAVKRILTATPTTTKSPNTGDKQLEDIIERVTQQVVQAYIKDKSTDGDKKQSARRADSNMNQHRIDPSPTRIPHRPLMGETVPAFRVPRIDRDTYREMHRVQRKEEPEDDLSKYAVPVNTYGQRLQYVPRVKSQDHSQPRRENEKSKEDQAYFYVTGKGITKQDTVAKQGEVTLKVLRNSNQQPKVEHVTLSETESGSETGTPLATRKSATLSPGRMTQEGKQHHTYRGTSATLPSSSRGIPIHEPAKTEISSPRKIKGILRTSPKGEQKGQASSTVFQAKSPPKHFDNRTVGSRYQKKPTQVKQVEKKPYDSVLLRPVQDKPTPLSVAKKFAEEDSRMEKRSKLNDARKGYLDLLPKNPSWPKGTVMDAAFEEKKRRWNEQSATKDTRKKGLVVVDIDIDQGSQEDKKSKSQSSEDLKRKLSATRLKAPNSSEIDQRWQSLAKLKPYRSHGNLLDESSMSDSSQAPRKSSDDRSTSAADLRRARSLGTLPSQFFANKRSYTSLLETDLDTGVCTETPLVYETDLDGTKQAKARSLTNLSVQTSMVPIDIDEERRKSFETLPREGSGLLYSLPQDNASDCSSLDTSQERSLSAGELRITQSLNKLSIPSWYRQSFGKGKKPVELTHTRQFREGSSFSDSLDSSFEFHRREDSISPGGLRESPQPQVSKPIVIQHRVSHTMRAKSPIPVSPSATSDKSGPFELPSARLKTQHVELKPVETKSAQYPPVQIPKKHSAKEAYLKLKAQSQAQEDVLNQANHDKHQASGNHRVVNGMNDDHFSPRSYITLTPQTIPGERPRTYNTGRDSGLVPSPRAKSPINGNPKGGGHTSDAKRTGAVKSYEPGVTCSGLVEGMKLEKDTDMDQHIPADAVYSKMLDNIETKRREIQEHARIITTDKSVPPGLLNRNETELEKSRKSFPVLAYNESPGSFKKRKESLDKKGSFVELSFVKDEDSIKSSSSNTPRSGGIPKDSSLDQILGGLLAIPSTSNHTSPSSEEDEVSMSPNKRVFQLLRTAITPRGSMTSVNTSKSHENVSEAEDNIDFVQAYDSIAPEFALDLYPKQPEKCTEEAAVVRCRNPKCKKATLLPEARDTYKTCHNCFTYYCGRECRKAHWERHKRKCLFSRINSVCKHIVKKIHDTPELLENISRVARTGYMSKGRGCILIAFSSPEKADTFLKEGHRDLETPPGYANLRDLKEINDVLADHYYELVDMCKVYNPEIKFVIEVAVVAGQEIPAWPVPRREGPVIKKCAKLRLSTDTRPKSPRPREAPETLILTAVPGSEFTENMEEKKAREICFVNIQRKLRQKGVTLRHHFPDVYNKLCAYVAENVHFTPMTIYPIDANTGKRFMCLIMPNSEPEVEWMHNPDLLDELGLATQV